MPINGDVFCFDASISTASRRLVRFAILVAIVFSLVGNTFGAGQIWVNSTLPSAKVGIAYSAPVTFSGGHAPYNFVISTGALPPGLTLNASTGLISGTPSAPGKYLFNVDVTDTSGSHGDKDMSLLVAQSGIAVAISPTSATVNSSASKQFTAYVTGTSNSAVNWSATGGSIDGAGLFVAPSVTSDSNFSVIATSVADPSKHASAQVIVLANSGNGLAVTTTSLPDATAGQSYTLGLSASGGTLPYIWSVSSGSLPSGLQLSSSGTLSGTTSKQGQFTFTVRVTDANSATATQGLSLTVLSQTGNFDGPAELPRVYLQSSLASTPAPGNTILLPAGGNFQAALNNANCGDTIQLQAGATFPGKFLLPAKSCDDNHWIIIRTSAPDSSLPTEGTRLTPCYAGVASLPGRPPFHCSSTQKVLPQILYTGIAGIGPFKFVTGANHYRFIGLEITRAPGSNLDALMAVEKGGTADKIVVDRSWLHGDPHWDSNAGIVLSHTTNVAVIDSFFTDFHCAQVCIDSKAIGGGNYTAPGGPYKIVNNFLEASGENIIFGGAASTTTPADIEIRRNHFFKPMIWKKGQPGFVGNPAGKPFIVKNHFELKNAQRVLFEANILENAWGGFSQNGFSILLGPKNQASGTLSICPLCQVTDVTVRYTTISHVGAGLQISTGVNKNGAQALAGERYSIHDVTIDDISAANYDGSGTFAQVANSWHVNPLNSVTINHVSGFPDAAVGHVMTTRNLLVNPPMWGFVFTNNIVLATQAPIRGTGGGTLSCSYGNIPKVVIPTCFTTYSFSGNALVGTPSQYGPSTWPSGNFFPADPNAVQFTNYNYGNGGNYQLLPSSPYAHAGTDGKDLGADVAAIQSALAGVY